MRTACDFDPSYCSLRAIDPERYAIVDESQDGQLLEEIEARGSSDAPHAPHAHHGISCSFAASLG